MGRPREEPPEGGVYHLYGRGVDGCALFRDDGDRHVYLRLVELTVAKHSWRCLAYCLMTNHVHLVVQTVGPDRGPGMQTLHGRYARHFNRRHGRTGHLFQGRYGTTTIVDDGHLCMTLRYVARNPVEANLCERPADWSWSSCAATLDGTAAPWLDRPRVLAAFDWLGGDPLERYAELVHT